MYDRYGDAMLPDTTVYHTPLGRLSMVDISMVGIVPVPKRSALEASRRERASRRLYRCGRTIGHLTVREFTVTGDPLFLFAFLVSS